MKIINKKYIKIIFTLVCIFLVGEKVNAKEITCQYSLDYEKTLHKTLTLVYSSDGSAIQSELTDTDYILYYQFDDGTKYYLPAWFKNSQQSHLFPRETDVLVTNGILHDTLMNNGCPMSIWLAYNDAGTRYGIFDNAPKYSQMASSETTTVFVQYLTSSSEEGRVYEVRLNLQNDKTYSVYSGSTLAEISDLPSFESLGYDDGSGGYEYCWSECGSETSECWDFNNPITSDLELCVTGYLPEEDAGFKNDIDKKYVSCNGVNTPYGVIYIVYNIIKIIQILTPIILIILGMIDFGKAVVASDERQMKESSSKFIRRVIAAVIIFFVIAIVKFVFKQLVTTENGVLGCANCFLNNNCETYYIDDDGNRIEK